MENNSKLIKTSIGVNQRMCLTYLFFTIFKHLVNILDN